MAYPDEDLLALSGIQHMAFCPRQWALIHIERQWQENLLTIEGRFLHEKADNPYIVEKRRDLIVSRAVNLASYELGLCGVADIVEFWQAEGPENAVKLPKRQGFWRPMVVEYKRGRPKHTDCDEVQLCAQTICLEEMLGVSIATGALFYDAVKRRESVTLTEALRERTQELAKAMHRLYTAGLTPIAEVTKSCTRCSLNELCLPDISKRNAAAYLRTFLSS